MNVTQVFQLLGIIYVVAGLGILINPRYYKKMIDEYVRSLPVIFINGFLVLIMAYFILLANNTWDDGLPVIVTILGWLAFIKGLVILILPNTYISWAKKIKMRFLAFEAVFALLLGLVFIYLGFVR